MNTMLAIYLISQADCIREFFAITALITAFLIGGTLFVGWCEDLTKLYRVLWFLPYFAFAVIMANFFPTQKTMMLMVSGKMVMEIAESPKAQEITGNSIDLVNTYISNLLEEQKKKKDKP